MQSQLAGFLRHSMTMIDTTMLLQEMQSGHLGFGDRSVLHRDDIRILLLENISCTAVDRFRSAGYININRRESTLSERELSRAISEANIVGLRSRTNLGLRSERKNASVELAFEPARYRRSHG
jgi:hypothetical protein